MEEATLGSLDWTCHEAPGGSLAKNDTAAALPEIFRAPQKMDSRGRQKVDRDRSRRWPGRRPAAISNSQ